MCHYNQEGPPGKIVRCAGTDLFQPALSNTYTQTHTRTASFDQPLSGSVGFERRDGGQSLPSCLTEVFCPATLAHYRQ